jgi:hypothetical protein
MFNGIVGSDNRMTDPSRFTYQYEQRVER